MAIHALVQDFTAVAQRVGTVIIEEAHLPPAARSIQPLGSGKGVAGGEKFLVANIFFKFARDVHGIFGGDEAAGKAANREVRALQALVKVSVRGLAFPIMCTIEHLGHRLVAVSLLDIDDSTLVYGSGDQAATVHTRDGTMNAMMKQACTALNLAPHAVGQRGRKYLLWGCADIEGHRVKSASSDQEDTYYGEATNTLHAASSDPHTHTFHLVFPHSAGRGSPVPSSAPPQGNLSHGLCVGVPRESRQARELRA